MTLKVDRISKALGAFALRDVNLEVGDKEYFSLLGPTGAGKSALLEVIMGFSRPDEGKIVLDGQDITYAPPEKRGVGYVPQNCPLFPHMTVYENVEFGLKMRKTSAVERKEATCSMLRLVGIETLADRTPMTLSGGERQKTVLARVLATKPKIALLDEPLASIDAEASRSLRKELKRINRDLGVAVVHVTHDQIEGFSLADRVAIMMKGKIVQEGRPSEVASNPVDESVARFLGYENIFRVKVVKCEHESTVMSVDGTMIRMNGKVDAEEATVMIRPEDVVITAGAPLKSEEWNILEGEVRGYLDLGPVVEVTVDAGLTVKMIVDKRAYFESNLADGKRVHVGFRVDSVKVLSVSP